jgi:RNA polymerase sigma-54 factor
VRVALGARLEFRQGQSLAVTPQLQQAIKLLQLSNLELEAFVEAELERNPLLQREDADAAPEEPAEPKDAADTAGPARDLALTGEDAAPAEGALDAGYDDLYADASVADRAQDQQAHDRTPLVDWSAAAKGGGVDFDGDELERLAPRAKSLAEHLQDQLLLARFSAVEHTMALALIDGVDEAGYLRTPLSEIADRLNCGEDQLEAVLARCQGFEPTGVMARSLDECLALQLKERGRFDPAIAAMLDNLELLARRDLQGLRQVCGVDDEDLREMIAELKALPPRPCAAFGAEPAPTVVPDVFVREDPMGGWRVELNSDTLPRLLVDQRYRQTIAGKARSDAEKTFVSDCLSSANWLVKSLDQRARTILKVSSEIVRQQDGFFAFGIEHLRPLNLKTVADAIGMHESTVSRVTANKHMATPRGLYEMKFFFSSAIANTSGGEAHSSESVRKRIKQLIDAEAAEADVLSDDRIVEILKQADVDIARRTVAKYRDVLRIPSAVERRRILRVSIRHSPDLGSERCR